MKWQLAYQERWTAPEAKPALARGTLWHQVMEGHYRTVQAAQRSGDWTGTEDALKRSAAQLLLDQGGNPKNDECELVAWMYEGHLQQYGLDEGWEIIAVEHRSSAYLPTEAGTRSRFRLKVRADLIVRDLTDRRIDLVDHKSGKDLPTKKVLDIDDQFGLYTWAYRQLGKRIFAAIHSAARTQRNKSKPQPLDERFSRTMMFRSDAELDEIALDAYRTMRAAYRPDNGVQPYSSPNPDQCKWRCDFLDAHLAARKGSDLRLYLTDIGHRQVFERH